MKGAFPSASENAVAPDLQAIEFCRSSYYSSAAGNRKSRLSVSTQNPLEQEGTYPLPEVQLDRFMFLVTVDYPQ
jgi:MoxR-like ATPase